MSPRTSAAFASAERLVRSATALSVTGVIDVLHESQPGGCMIGALLTDLPSVWCVDGGTTPNILEALIGCRTAASVSSSPANDWAASSTAQIMSFVQPQERQKALGESREFGNQRKRVCAVGTPAQVNPVRGRYLLATDSDFQPIARV